LIFSDFDLEASKADDIRLSLDQIPWIEHGWHGFGGFPLIKSAVISSIRVLRVPS
jgi:hypothetical protein